MITWESIPEADGTRLKLTHQGFIIALLKARATQLTEELAKNEKKIRAYRNEVHQGAKDFWHLANVDASDVHASEYAGRRREELLKRVIEMDSG